MDEEVDRLFRNTFHNSGNRNTIRDCRYYGETTLVSSSSNGNDLERSVFIMDALHHKDGFLQENESLKKEKIPCQNVEPLGRQNRDDGSELDKMPINVEFNDFCEKTKDCAIHVQGFDSQWKYRGINTDNQQVNSRIENEDNTSNLMVLFECSGRLQKLRPSLGPLLRIDTLKGSTRTDPTWASSTWTSSTWMKEIPQTPCHFILPDNQFEIRKNETDLSIPQMSVSDEINETHGHRRSLSIVVDIVMKSNRNYIATSLGLKVQDNDQGDDIGNIKEDLVCYIEEVRDYGFNHIIIIGERYCGLLFMDCFGRVFSLDSMSNVLWFLGDYSERVERVAKGLKAYRVPWIVKSNGIVIDIKDDTPYDLYTFPTEKINKKKKSKKKNSRKKRH